MEALFQAFPNRQRFLRTLQRENVHLEEDYQPYDHMEDYGGWGGENEDNMEMFFQNGGRNLPAYNFRQRHTNQRNIVATYDPVSLSQRQRRRGYQLGELGGVVPRQSAGGEKKIPADLTNRILSVLKEVHKVSNKRNFEKEKKKKEKEMKTFKENLEKQISEIEDEKKKLENEEKEEEKEKEGSGEGQEDGVSREDMEIDSSDAQTPILNIPPNLLVGTGDGENLQFDFRTPERGTSEWRDDTTNFFGNVQLGPEGISPIVAPPLQQQQQQQQDDSNNPVIVLPPRPPAAIEEEQQQEEGSNNDEEEEQTGENNEQQEQQEQEQSGEQDTRMVPSPSTPTLLTSQDGDDNQQQQQQQAEAPQVPQAPPRINFPIDPSFLGALPPDLRQEIIQQNLPALIGTRTQAEPPAGNTTISSQFLDAVTDDIRQEILNQERQLLQSQQQVFNSFMSTNPPVVAQPQDNNNQQAQQQQQGQQQQAQQQQQGGEQGQEEQGNNNNNEEEGTTTTTTTTTDDPDESASEDGQRSSSVGPSINIQPPQAQQQQQQPPQQQQGQQGQQQQQQAQAPAVVANPARIQQQHQEYDPALFIQSLPPHLRREVLMTAEPDVINRLPPDLASEALRLRSRPAFGRFFGGGEEDGGGGGGFGGLYYGRRGRGRGRARRRGGASRSGGSARSEYQSTRNKLGEAILSDVDILSIMRLLYIHPLFSRDQVHRIFKNVMCVKSSREFIFKILFSLLSHRVEGYKAVKIPDNFHKLILMDKMYGMKKGSIQEDDEEDEDEEVEGEGESDDELEELIEKDSMVDEEEQEKEKKKEEDDNKMKDEEEDKVVEEKKKKKKKKKVYRIPKLVRERVIDLIGLLTTENQTFTELFTCKDIEKGILRNPTYSLLKIFHHNTTTEVLRQHIISLVNRIYDVVKIKGVHLDKKVEDMRNEFDRIQNAIETLKKQVEEAKKREEEEEKEKKRKKS